MRVEGALRVAHALVGAFENGYEARVAAQRIEPRIVREDRVAEESVAHRAVENFDRFFRMLDAHQSARDVEGSFRIGEVTELLISEERALVGAQKPFEALQDVI